jgi:hypothetical protein
MAVFKINQSKVKAWRQCRLQYHYKYVMGLSPKIIKRAFTFGSMVHKMIEAYAEGDDPMEVLDQIGLENANLFRAEREMYGEIVSDIRHIMEEYFAYWAERGDDIRYWRHNKRSAEHYFELELEPGILMKGTIDAIGKAKKLRWLVEHKTFSRMPNEDFRWRNLQSAVYIRAIEMLGWGNIDGTLWDYIRSKPPSKPELLKSGQLSKRSIDTLPNVLLATLNEYGLDPNEYPELIEAAKAGRNKFFIRTFTPVNREVVDAVFHDYVDTVHEIVDLHGKSKTRFMGQHCDYCQFNQLCRAELTGGDVDFLIEREYKRDEETTDDVEDESTDA